MFNMDLLREQVKQRLSAAADEVFELFLKSIEEYMDLIRSPNRTALQMADIQLESGESQESQVQQGCNPRSEVGLSCLLQIKQEPVEPKKPWSHQEDQQLQEEAFPSSTVQMSNAVKDIQLESGESQESQVQQGCNPSLKLGLSLPLQIKQEPAEPKKPWSHQEDQQLQEEAFPSSTVQMSNAVKAGPAADAVLLDGPHVKPPEQQQWSSSVKQEVVKQEPKEAEFTKSLLPDEAKSSPLPQIEGNQLSCEEPMETENGGDDGGGLEAAQQSASEETANSSDTEDSEDEWKKTKQTHFKLANVVEPEPTIKDSKKLENTNPTHTEIKKDAKSEPACNSVLTCDPVSEDKTSDSSDAETENRNRHQKKRLAVETKQLPEAAASSKWKKYCRKSSGRQSVKQSLPCPQCGKEFFYRLNLLKHLKSHSDPKKGKHKGKTNVVCSVCGKTFAEQVHLDLHTRIHKVKTHKNMETSSQNKVGSSGGNG